jgi:hypothetical protein
VQKLTARGQATRRRIIEGASDECRLRGAGPAQHCWQVSRGVGVLMSTGDLTYLEAALDEGIRALRR